jgi:hypothetical protein
MTMAKIVHVNLRMSPELHRKLVKAAKSHKHSLNHCINLLLEWGLNEPSKEEKLEKVQAQLEGIPFAEQHKVLQSAFDLFITDWLKNMEGGK